MFTQLHNPQGIYINTDHVILVRRASTTESEGGIYQTVIKTTDGFELDRRGYFDVAVAFGFEVAAS